MTDAAHQFLFFAQHGWGFDSSAWRAWLPLLPQDCSLAAGDRGYFGNPFVDRPSLVGEDCRLIVISHSLGLHLLQSEVLEKAEYLVIISGFKHFHLNERSASRRTVRRMQARIQTRNDATGLLSDFYTQCFNQVQEIRNQILKAKIPFGDVLIKDLALLNESQLCLDNLNKIPISQILILHGEQDSIVPLSHAIELSELLADRSRLFVCPEAGHALPFSHSAWCMDRIAEMLRDPGRDCEQYAGNESVYPKANKRGSFQS